ncbi:MAG TPA: glycosyltransferase family 9 protein [Puia sp.]|nr:glycosyltransferase family 9 protein [Puia sp.]
MIMRLFYRMVKSSLFRRLINPGYKTTPLRDGDLVCVVPGEPNKLGDLIMNNHCLQILQRHYSLSYGVLDWYLERNRDFLENHCYARDLLVFPTNLWKMVLFIREIKKRKYKAAILLPYFPKRTDVCFYLAGVPVISALGGTSAVSTHHYNVEKFANQNHYTAAAPCILDALGIDHVIEPDDLPWFPFTKMTPEECKRKGGILMTLHIGGGTFWMRRWPPEKFLELAKLFLDQYEGKIFLVGGGEEFEENEAFKNALVAHCEDKDRVVNFCGSSSCNRFANIIAASDIFLGNDSGPMHMATALKKRVICIFGPSNIPFLNPTYVDERNATIYLDLECVPCKTITCRLPEDKQYSCLKDLPVGMVWAKLQAAIESADLSRSLHSKSLL